MFQSLFEYFIHVIFITGIIGLIAGFVLGFIPFVGRYKLPIQVVSIILFSVGLYYEGALAKDREWGLRVAKLEAKLAEAKVEGGKVTAEIVTQVVTQKQIIREKGKTIIEYVNTEVGKHDSTCPIPESVVLSHNAAAKNDTTGLGVVKPADEVPTKDHNELAKPRIKLAPKK